MTITKLENKTELTLFLEGRLDTLTAPLLDAEVKGSVENKTALVLDLKKLEYISSAGLRVLLSAQKIMNKQGSMTVLNVSEPVMEVFEITGFSDILNIK